MRNIWAAIFWRLEPSYCLSYARVVRKRRFLVLVSSAIAGVVSLPLLKPFLYDFGERFVPSMPGPATTGSLSPAEIETLIAYTEVLCDVVDLSEETRQTLRSHIDERTQNDPGYLSLFRMAAKFVDQLGGGKFSNLSREARTSALERRGLMSCRVHRRECFSPFGRTERTIRALAATDLVSAYYRTAGGWAVAGYSSPQGRCGDLARYTQAES